MTIPEKQIKIKDVTKITNPRYELMKSARFCKPFIFKGYKTEKDRIVNK